MAQKFTLSPAEMENLQGVIRRAALLERDLGVTIEVTPALGLEGYTYFYVDGRKMVGGPLTRNEGEVLLCALEWAAEKIEQVRRNA